MLVNSATFSPLCEIDFGELENSVTYKYEDLMLDLHEV